MFIHFLCSLALATPTRDHLATFEAEADARGVEVDVRRVRVRRVARLEDAGFCIEERRPVVLLRRSTWRELDHANQEALLFHELGHCLLGRPHHNGLTEAGEWASVMRGGALPEGHKSWIHFAGERRRAYLDELFGVERSASGWTAPTTPERAAEPTWSEPLSLTPGRAPHTRSLGDGDGMTVVLESPVHGASGLLWLSERPLYLSLDAEHGVVVGVLGEPRPWTNGPLAPGRHTLWMVRDADRLMVGVDDQVVTAVLEAELGASATAVGVYTTGLSVEATWGGW